MADNENNLEESMKKTLEEIKGKDEEGEENEELEAVSSEVEEIEEIEEEVKASKQAKEDKGRDEKGRFKAKGSESSGIQSEEADQHNETENGVEAGPTIGLKEEQKTPLIGGDKLSRPPTTWRPLAKSKWKDIDPDIRAEILKREEDGISGVSQMREKATYGERLNNIINPYMPTINASGGTPEGVIQNLLNTAYRLQTGTPQDKAQVLLAAARQYGADMSVLGMKQDPAQQQVAQQFQPYIGKIQQLEQRLHQFENQTANAESNQIISKIEEFSNANDGNGNLLHPYFEDVRIQMSNIIQTASEQGKTLTLEQAYDEAIWSNPDTRSIVMSEKARQDDGKRQKEAKDRAARAKKSDKINLSKNSSYESKQLKPIVSVEQTMREKLKEIKAHV